MSSPVVCTFLFGWILPLVLLGACCFRINGFSLIYLCCLLAVPLLPSPSRAVTSTDHFQKAILGLSVVALTSQIVFQIVLGAFPPHGHFFPNCSTYEQLTRQIGLSGAVAIHFLIPLPSSREMMGLMANDTNQNRTYKFTSEFPT